MNSQFIARPRDFICSSLSLDFDYQFVDEYQVIINGKKMSEKYSSFKEIAEQISLGILSEYQSKDYIIEPYYPKIILSVSKTKINKLLSHHESKEKIYTIVKKNKQNPIIFHNRSQDTTILTDLTRIELKSNQENMQSIGCVSATSLLNLDIKVNHSDNYALLSHINQIIGIVKDLGLQKQRLIQDKLINNQYQILGKPRKAHTLKFLFNYECPLVCMRMFNLKNIFHKSIENVSDTFNYAKDLISYISDKLETPRSNFITPVLGQTSSSSEAINRAIQRYKKPLDIKIDRYGLYSSINTQKINSQLHNEAKLQRYMRGGMLSSIKIDINDFALKDLKHYIQKCVDNNIEFFNLIDVN